MRSDALEYDLKIGMIGNSSLTEEEKYIFEGVLGHPPKVYAEKELLYQYLLFAFSLVSGVGILPFFLPPFFVSLPLRSFVLAFFLNFPAPLLRLAYPLLKPTSQSPGNALQESFKSKIE